MVESARNLWQKSRGFTVIISLVLLIVLVLLISMNTGFIRLTPLEVIRTFFGGGTDKQHLILFDFRLPRIVISILIGMGLAVSGCILQGITRNGLSDPGILGINAGAGLAVLTYIMYFPTTISAPVFFLPMLAFVGASGTASLIYMLSFKKNEGASPIRLILNGIGIAAAISAATVAITLRLSPEKFQFVERWNAGAIWGTNWKFVLALLPWILILIPYSFYKSRTLDVLNLGEQLAAGLGAKVEGERLRLLAVAVALAGACVAVSGGISFVGLIAPHLARRLVGSKHQILLPTSALAGGLLVIISDTIGRVAFQPSEIPTGLVIAVIGAPYFLYLLARSKEK
ncbi:FecCD family ABC transporter permease [Cohnella lupini]|uniref:Iron complex transport system permease protein n=1 Tax=Cohnella lupini TaxID=1294267 RepID=A0A3D9HYX9_9BACL|nr:iron ABC transporter permease [Cohnella lupini]RED54712.1 iron complex transport system permease protein [Cohnella lupini]